MNPLATESHEFFAKEAEVWESRYQSRTYRQRRGLVCDVVSSELVHLHRDPAQVEVLDFGCASGVIIDELLQLGVCVTGVDRSKEMIAKARARFSSTARVRLQWLEEQDASAWYANDRYDIVLCISVLEFVSKAEQMLARLCSVVRPGGILVLTVPNRRSWLRRLETFIHQHPHWFSRFPRLSYLTTAGSYLTHQQRQFTFAEIVRVAESLGLKTEQHRFHVAPVCIKLFEQSPLVGMMVMLVFRKAV